MSNETWHNYGANIIFGLIPFAYLAGHQSQKVHIKVAKMQQKRNTYLLTLVLIWRPTSLTHRFVGSVRKLSPKWFNRR